ncbi:PAS domain-containing protein [Flavobacterium sp.]|uniref:PAS domain-containing sensor histidine kinase n=1 Tax=Flavobacterium sp. TaxID=239 RepID=UPI002608F49A|nr:PAS domain-containing protein [Flavobacterium sp.]
MNTNNAIGLQQAYEQLQLRVTRFSATEQKLIAAQDRLDHELTLYKRLSNFNSKALQSSIIEHLGQLAVETIVDLLEVEAAVVVLMEPETGIQKLFTEGMSSQLTKSAKKSASLFHFFKQHLPFSISLLEENQLEHVPELEAYEKGALIVVEDALAGIHIGCLGLVSKLKSPLYSSLNPTLETLFQIFSQQFLALTIRLQQHLKIQHQLDEINKSKMELTKLSLIAKKINNNVIIANNHGEIEWVNDSFVKTTGYKRKEIIGKKPKDFLKRAPQSESEHKRLVEALRDKKNVAVELINYTKNGKPYYNQIEIIPVFDPFGNHINFISVQKDITKEVHAPNEILRINKRFETIAEKAQIGIWEWEAESQKTQWNSILEQQLRIPRTLDPVDFYPFWKNCVHVEDHHATVERLHNFMRSNKSHLEYEYRIQPRNTKETRHVKTLLIAERTAEGKIVKLIGSNLDITEKHESEMQLDALKKYYESLFNHSPSQKIVLDKNLNVAFINESLLKIQPEWESFIGKNISELIQLRLKRHPLKNMRRMAQKVNDAIDLKKLIHYTDVVTTPNHKTCYRLIDVFPYFIEDTLQYVIINGVDISELKKTQKTIVSKNQELQKLNNELDNFVYRVSHDLRAPLLSIKGLVNLIFATENLDPNLKEYIQLIDVSVARLDDTIQEILEFSRNARLEVTYEHFNLKEMIHGIFDDLRFISDVQMEMTFQDNGSPWITSDRYRMATLLKNIIGNAVKYRNRTLSNPVVRCKLTETNQKIIIEVEVNGEGIAPEHLPKIFRMFFRGSNSAVGTGLGLYICKEITQKLNGALDVYSELGKGSRFFITLNKK